MKIKCLFLSSLLVSSFLVDGQVIVSGQVNLDVWKPYTKEAQEYMKSQNKTISSKSYSLFATYPIVKKELWRLSAGLGYKWIKHTAKEILIENGLNYDFVSRSDLLGVLIDFDFRLVNKKGYRGSIGTRCENYFFEKFNTVYRLSSNPVKTIDSPYNNHNFVNYENTFFNYIPFNSNLSIYYLSSHLDIDNLSIGLRISAGLNIYSNWNQFSRYAWVGLGLEFGFGRYELKKVVD